MGPGLAEIPASDTFKFLLKPAKWFLYADNQLFVNQTGDLRDSFKVTQYRGDFVITVQYEREPKLLLETRQIPFEKTVTLNR
jgi:hypothetical protein